MYGIKKVSVHKSVSKNVNLIYWENIKLRYLIPAIDSPAEINTNKLIILAIQLLTIFTLSILNLINSYRSILLNTDQVQLKKEQKKEAHIVSF